MQPFEILSDEEFDELEALLERYGSDNSIASMSMLDGFLTAVVSGPHLIMPSTWLHAIWGGEQDQPLTIPSYERGVARLLRYDRHP